MSTADAEIYPYYHPTTVFVVDDDVGFLQNIGLYLDSKLACRFFSSAAEALVDIENTTMTHLAQATPYWCDECIPPRRTQNLVELDLASLAKGMENPDRFAENSVILIDYDMPFVNGVEFCKMLKNTAAKKLLVSGVVDDKRIVKAFNEGVIYKYLSKASYSNPTLLNDCIFEAQNAYFKEKTASIKYLLNSAVYGFINEPEFIKIFHELRESKNIVEYYMTTDPCGFILLDEQGKRCQILVYSEEELSIHVDIIRDQHAPFELYEAVKDRTMLPFFPTQDGYYAQGIHDWRSYVYPAKKICHSSIYYYAVVDDPPFDGKLPKSICHYDQHMA